MFEITQKMGYTRDPHQVRDWLLTGWGNGLG